MRTYQRSPMLKTIRLPKIHHVIFNGFPLDLQLVLIGFFHASMLTDAMATFGRQKVGHRLGNLFFKLSLFAGLDVQMRNFNEHVCLLDEQTGC